MIKYSGAADTSAPTTPPKLTQKQSDTLKAWRAEVEAAEARQKKPYIDVARPIISIYEAAKKSTNSFNILFSNTETMLPAIFSANPKPVVRRRYNDADPLGKAASQVLQRTLQFLLNTGSPAYPTFFDSVQQDVVNALVPGRGISWVCYTAGIEVVFPADQSLQSDDGTAKGAEATTGTSPDEVSPEATEKVNFETIYLETVPWDRFIHGFARNWSQVPWVGRKHYLSRQELYENFGPIGNLVKLTHQGDRPEDGKDNDLKDAANISFAEVYEVWDRKSRRVMYFTMTDEFFLKDIPDPLSLEGFFPCPKPLQFIKQVSTILPKPPYVMYEEQAKELNSVSHRINKIISALKVRGFYDATLPDLDRLMESDDNTLLPIDNAAQVYGQGGSLEKSLFMMPLEKLINVLQQLYVQRQQVKQVIYEITGLNDILRGASVASETATAQDLKDKWGSLRLKTMQKSAESYILGLLRIMAETATQLFSVETFQQMTQLKFPTNEQKQQAQMAMQQFQAQAQMAAQQPPQPGQPPAQPPQLPAELTSILSSPSWEDILALLQNDMARNFVITIETSSSILDDAQNDKADVAEFMNALSQFMNGIAPMIADGTLPFEAAKAMLLAVTKRFNFGQEVEDELVKMAAPESKADPAAEKAQAEMQRDKQLADIELQGKQADVQFKQAEVQGKMELMQAQMEFEREKIQLEREKLQIERERLRMELEKMQMEMGMQAQTAQFEAEAAAADQQTQMRQMELDSISAERSAAMEEQSAMREAEHEAAEYERRETEAKTESNED